MGRSATASRAAILLVTSERWSERCTAPCSIARSTILSRPLTKSFYKINGPPLRRPVDLGLGNPVDLGLGNNDGRCYLRSVTAQLLEQVVIDILTDGVAHFFTCVLVKAEVYTAIH